MRILGKGSIASFLRRLLNIIWYALFAVIACLLIGAAVWAFVSLPAPINNMDSPIARWYASGSLALTALGLCVTQLIVARLRRIFNSLSDGQVFSRDTARHVRAIGLICICGSALTALASIIFGFVLSGASGYPGMGYQMMGGRAISAATGIFFGLLILVLSSVFGMAAGLQEDSDLTV